MTSSTAISSLLSPVATSGEHLALPVGQQREARRARPAAARAGRRTRRSACRVTLGDSSASPAATTRTARSRSSGSVSFSRKPLAPDRNASKTYSSSSNVVRIDHPDVVEVGVGEMLSGRLQSVQLRHADVHQDDVGARLDG